MTTESGREPFSEAPSDTQRQSETPLPQPRPSSVLVALLGLALLYTLYFAKTLLLPLVIALLFALLLGPLVALFKRLYIPRPLSAVLLIAVLLGPFTLLTIELAGPAQKWAKRLPELSEQLTTQLTEITEALQEEEVIEGVQVPQAEPEPEPQGWRFMGWFRSDPEPEPDPEPATPSAPERGGDNEMAERVMQGSMELAISMLSATPLVLAQLLTTIILIIFLLVFGPNLFTAFVDHFPSRREKRQTIALVRTVQHELSRYILTVSAINACLGIVTGLTLWALGVEDAALWGAVVGLANFAPYVGPILSMVMLALAGLVQYGPELAALIPVLAFFCINLIEAQFVTPMVLGHNMRLNPLVIMVWLLIWGWLWGAAGVLLAVPLLVCIKLAFGQLNVLPDWVRIIETRA